MNIFDSMRIFVDCDFQTWEGLPSQKIAEYNIVFGAPVESIDAVLGYYPAIRHRYVLNQNEQFFLLWERSGSVIMVETMNQPSITILDKLSESYIVLDQEVFVPNMYAHEYLYWKKGLVLTVGQDLSSKILDLIIRCRGIKKLETVGQFDSHYYRALEDSIQWDSFD